MADSVRRIVDIMASVLVLLLGAPVMALIALLILRESPGPVVFRQERLGKDGRPFVFYKCRTMYADWPHRFPDMVGFKFDSQALDQIYLQLAVDPRVTPLGSFLRRSSLDELPNFWNILRGEMTLVGPRPELVEMLPYYDRVTRAKFSVKPGLTGWSQIQGRGELNFADTVVLDLEYIQRRSLLFDLKIVVATLRAVFSGKGAY